MFLCLRRTLYCSHRDVSNLQIASCPTLHGNSNPAPAVLGPAHQRHGRPHAALQGRRLPRHARHPRHRRPQGRGQGEGPRETRGHRFHRPQGVRPRRRRGCMGGCAEGVSPPHVEHGGDSLPCGCGLVETKT